MMQRSVPFRVLVSKTSSYVSMIGARCYTTWAASSPHELCELSKYSESSEDECSDIDWNNMGFGLTQTDYMYMMKCDQDEQFTQGQLNRYGNIELSPSAGVLNYGQGLFEGTKAYRREDGGLFLFRPNQNALRMQIGAERMCMPSPSIEQFVNAVKQTALANRRWIPPPGKGSLYIRPLLMEGTAPLNLYVEDKYHRAMHGGAGGVKSITNYAPGLKAIAGARKKGFSDVLYLDSLHKRYVEEVSSCNVFMVKNNVLSTPVTNGTILEGVTRKSIIEIAQDLDYQFEERCIPIEELMDADEVFCTGTAVGVAPVGSITYKGHRRCYEISREAACLKMYGRLMRIQGGVVDDNRGWVVQIS